MRNALVLAALSVAAVSQSSCMAVGYSSGGGWFIWPGGLGLVVLIVIVFLLVKRRR